MKQSRLAIGTASCVLLCLAIWIFWPQGTPKISADGPTDENPPGTAAGSRTSVPGEVPRHASSHHRQANSQRYQQKLNPVFPGHFTLMITRVACCLPQPLDAIP